MSLADLRAIAQACSNENIQSALSAFRAEQYKTSFDLLLPCAQAGNKGAQFALARQYAEGQGTPVSVRLAASWMEKSAMQGYAHAEYWSGMFYKTAVGVPQDDVKARRYLQGAVDQNFWPAYSPLAMMYEAGQGGPRDRVKAADDYEKAFYNGGDPLGKDRAAVLREPKTPPMHSSDELDLYIWNTYHYNNFKPLALQRQEAQEYAVWLHHHMATQAHDDQMHGCSSGSHYTEGACQ